MEPIMSPLVARDNSVWTSAQTDLPDGAQDDSLQLRLSAPDADWDPLTYSVIPLTANFGSNVSREDRKGQTISIGGSIVLANETSYDQISSDDDVAFLTCDTSDDSSSPSPSDMLVELMSKNLTAIVLYSVNKNWCSLNYDEPPSYSTILSMADPAEANTALGHLTNGTSNGSDVRVAIFGDVSDTDGDGGNDGGQSAVAMSVLYSITGIIALLFLGIIATGAVRAHRHPERYGPRRARNGRPAQSRAKGLAQAVLETLPIVKFKNQEPVKPDPNIDLETATTDGRDTIRSQDQNDTTEAQAQTTNRSETDATHATPAGQQKNASPTEDDGVENHLGCSICMENFNPGEDVRVLPCDHRFHPACVDPWLVNVSGTCPLCRVDLRPTEDRPANQTRETTTEADNLPPPLPVEDNNEHHRGRFSRFLDIHRLRHASLEERMAALQRLGQERRNQERTVSRDEAAQTTENEEQRQRVSDRLRDRFRIFTRSHRSGARDC